ncbi:SigE family RNA polymerase sigma factor, partial [Streptomyces sp900116325]
MTTPVCTGASRAAAASAGHRRYPSFSSYVRAR